MGVATLTLSDSNVTSPFGKLGIKRLVTNFSISEAICVHFVTHYNDPIFCQRLVINIFSIHKCTVAIQREFLLKYSGIYIMNFYPCKCSHTCLNRFWVESIGTIFRSKLHLCTKPIGYSNDGSKFPGSEHRQAPNLIWNSKHCYLIEIQAF